jgi:alkylation response protein AidB-like acyl-CoA dehydrogenase
MIFAMEEPEVTFDLKYVATQATGNDDGYVMSGTKLFVPYASIADSFLVVTRTDGKPGDEKGLTIFRVKGDTPGIQLTPLQTLAGDKQFEVAFDQVPVSSGDIVGSLNQGFALAKSVTEKATAIQCAEMLGGAQYELEITAEYGRTRVQFNRPIGTFQAVQHRLADMYMDVLGARLTTYQAVWRFLEGLPAAREVAIAKVFTSNAVRRVAFSAQQIHAGMGYDLDHELHYYYRRAKNLELRMGSVPAQLNALQRESGL